MNRIFKVLWNAATGTFIVTSETAKSRGKKSGRRKLAVSALIGLSSIMISADALAKAGNDTGAGVTPTGTQTGGTGWIAIGTDATANTYTNVDGASAAMGYKASAMGKWSTAIGSYSDSSGDSSLALGVKA
ncbi:ESPR domain-containing protein, partial [Salmonella enterica]|nr:ESPR domain-containing protein [Salmonella enterica]